MSNCLGLHLRIPKSIPADSSWLGRREGAGLCRVERSAGQVLSSRPLRPESPRASLLRSLSLLPQAGAVQTVDLVRARCAAGFTSMVACVPADSSAAASRGEPAGPGRRGCCFLHRTSSGSSSGGCGSFPSPSGTGHQRSSLEGAAGRAPAPIGSQAPRRGLGRRRRRTPRVPGAGQQQQQRAGRTDCLLLAWPGSRRRSFLAQPSGEAARWSRKRAPGTWEASRVMGRLHSFAANNERRSCCEAQCAQGYRSISQQVTQKDAEAGARPFLSPVTVGHQTASTT